MLVLLAFDELDRVVDQVRVEVLDLLLRELDVLEPRDDLVVGEEPLLLPVLDELLEFFDVRKGDVDGEQIGTSAFCARRDGGLELPRHAKSRYGLPRLTLNAREIREAIARPVTQVVEALVNMLERTPPELAADLGARGVVLVGGGALLRGIDERIASETHLAVSIAESPLTCVALGAGQSLDEVSVLERVRKSGTA